ncbi:MAG: V-type ATP synthase subunit E [Spirochaetales bacterium]|nr:V-type ATP synthase subunit E [Spirochaetales bacterium]
MDIQLQELIDKIKSEGVASAEKEAASIVEEAEKKADAIVSQAEEEAKTIIEAAKQQKEQMLQSGRDALAQAGRDLILNVQAKLTSLFQAVIEGEVAGALSGEALQSAVSQIITSWSTERGGGVDVLIPEKEFTALEAGLRKKLAAKLAEGIEIKPTAQMSAGFRVSEKDGAAYFDFTPAEIAAALFPYLNPRLVETLQRALAE